MKAYVVFEDFSWEARNLLEGSGIETYVQPSGRPRPSQNELEKIIRDNDIIIIGTNQKIYEDALNGIDSPRIIGTISAGIDHIHVPIGKENQFVVLNVSNANSRSVGEYIMGVILMCSKRIMEGCRLYSLGKSNKELYRKPFELYGKTIGIVGAGDIARQVMEFSRCFGLDILCWTRNPSAHKDLCGVRFVSLKELCAKADIIVACLPYVEDTKEIINSECIKLMKSTAVFVSVSRSGILDAESLLEKAKEEKSFYVCLDIDVDSTYVNKYEMSDNIIITPHLAGITIESRRRMFINISQNIVNYLSLHKDL